MGRNGTIVPDREFFVKAYLHGLLVILGISFFRGVVSGKDMDSGFQTLSCARFGHRRTGNFDGRQQQTLTSSCHMREEAVLNRIMFGTPRWVVCHTDFQADALGQAFQVVLEDVAIGGITTTTITQQQQPPGLWIGEPAQRFPPVTDALAGKPTGIMAQSQIQMSKVSFEIIKAVWIKHTLSRTGKIMVQRFLGLLGIKPSFAKQQAEKLLVFGIHTEDGIGSGLVCAAVVINDLELSIPLRMFAAGKRFERLATAQAMTFEKLGHHRDTDAKAAPEEFLSDLWA